VQAAHEALARQAASRQSSNGSVDIVEAIQVESANGTSPELEI
jgi:hypothetical protein